MKLRRHSLNCIWVVCFIVLGLLWYKWYHYPHYANVLTSRVISAANGHRQFDRCIRLAGSHHAFHCPWPPVNVDDLWDETRGMYDLSLKPWVVSSGQVNSTQEQYIEALYRGNDITGSWLKRLVKRDIELRRVNENYQLYPQIMNVVEAVESVMEGRPVKQQPINDPVLEVLVRPRAVCARPDGVNALDLVVLVKSCAACVDNRTRARHTYMMPHLWPNFTVQFVFVTGLPKSHYPSVYEFDGVRLEPVLPRNSTGSIVNTTRTALLQEATQHGDMLIGNFEDDYFNLTTKLMFTFKWAAAFCRRQSLIYLFMDDDYGIVPSNMIQLVRQIPDSLKEGLCGGVLNFVSIVRPKPNSKNISPNRWTVSEDEIPWKSYPSYPAGACYMVGARALHETAIGMSFTRYFRVDDVFLGFVWKKLDKPFYALNGLFRTLNDKSNMSQVAVGPMDYINRVFNWHSGLFTSSTTPRTTSQTTHVVSHSPSSGINFSLFSRSLLNFLTVFFLLLH